MHDGTMEDNGSPMGPSAMPDPAGSSHIIATLPITPHMTYAQMRWAVDGLDVTIASDRLPDGLCGVYVAEANTILIDWRITYTRKRCALAHELAHWAHGDTSCRGQRADRQERRARRDAALLLIDPDDYMRAEAEYEGEPWSMAVELGVTLQVIKDYRELLDRSLVETATKRPHRAPTR